MKFAVILFFLLCLFNSLADDYPAYTVFEKGGDESGLEDILDDAADADVVLFGELHDNTLCHWLELTIARQLSLKNKDKMIIGAEMFESDDQLKIDEYFAGLYSSSNFEKESKLWSNYRTDYKPLLEFARVNGIKYIATNIPRRYSSFVGKNGMKSLDTLSHTALQYIAPPRQWMPISNCHPTSPCPIWKAIVFPIWQKRRQLRMQRWHILY